MQLIISRHFQFATTNHYRTIPKSILRLHKNKKLLFISHNIFQVSYYYFPTADSAISLIGFDRVPFSVSYVCFFFFVNIYTTQNSETFIFFRSFQFPCKRDGNLFTFHPGVIVQHQSWWGIKKTRLKKKWFLQCQVQNILSLIDNHLYLSFSSPQTLKLQRCRWWMSYCQNFVVKLFVLTAMRRNVSKISNDVIIVHWNPEVIHFNSERKFVNVY